MSERGGAHKVHLPTARQARPKIGGGTHLSTFLFSIRDVMLRLNGEVFEEDDGGVAVDCDAVALSLLLLLIASLFIAASPEGVVDFDDGHAAAGFGCVTTPHRC